MSKISFHRIPESLCKDDKGIKNDIEPIAPTMTVNRLVFKWEEKIKLHQEKEIEFDRWRNKNFKNERSAPVKIKDGVDDKGEELEVHYGFMEKIQEVLPAESSSTDTPLEQVDQNAAECVDERAALANLIANLTLDTEENKTVIKQLKKANASLTQELKECKTNLDETLGSREASSNPLKLSDPANRFCPNGEETVTLEKESRSKLDKDKVKPYDYKYQNSLYETFKPPSKTYLDQLEHTETVRKTMWRKTFNRTKPNIAKNVSFLPVSKSISKSRQVYNEMTNNFNHFRNNCHKAWSNHTICIPNLTAKSMEVLIKTLLMPLSNKTMLDSHCFVHELKTEMHDDLEYVKSLEKEVEELKSEKNKDAKSHKTTKRYMPVEKSSTSKNPERQIPTGHRFSNKKTTTVPEKTMNPRSCLRWKPTGRIFNTIGLKWVPTGKIFAFSTNKVDSEPPNGSKEDITNQCEGKQALDVSAGTLLSTGLVLHQMTSDHNRSELGIQDHNNEQSSSKLVPKV
ncbi:hypothetical protein Tco_0204267, partial [Tanacetum coccineum]